MESSWMLLEQSYLKRGTREAVGCSSLLTGCENNKKEPHCYFPVSHTLWCPPGSHGAFLFTVREPGMHPQSMSKIRKKAAITAPGSIKSFSASSLPLCDVLNFGFAKSAALGHLVDAINNGNTLSRRLGHDLW